MFAGEPTEGLCDPFGVTQVLVDVQGDEPGGGVLGRSCGCRVLPSVDVLPLVHERVHPAVVGLLQAREQSLPPQRGEVLGLIDDDGVQLLLDRQEIREFLEQPRHLLIEVLLPGSVGHAQGLHVVVELAHKNRPGLLPGGDLTAQVHAESLVVAEQPDALAVHGEALSLLDGEPGLAAAGAADEARAGDGAGGIRQNLLPGW